MINLNNYSAGYFVNTFKVTLFIDKNGLTIIEEALNISLAYIL